MTEDAYEEAKIEVADAMAHTAEIYGLNRSYGRVYGLLYFSDEPKSLDELAAESGYAKSTVSNAMTALERYHLVHRRSIPGDGRKVYFEAETDYWTIIREVLEQQGRREIRIMQRALRNAEHALDDAPETERTNRAAERIAQLQQLNEQCERMIDFFTNIPDDELLAIVEESRERDARNEE
ncbi:transcriptional regulator (plasmid) [Halostagnicola larsenii XH-48]|uniref:HTH-type transcriptional regulator n=1 Tax=Halostagnicola larsenii XH-48 TaxID=797299 RepID=W0JTI5_9EURY|nr:MarR family transcriptional regulator [Halostagnicola larsenii]AHG01889.1 transcriptional regulator [Halostagnicola larsenii XH-48]